MPVEDLDVKGMLESPRNNRNTAASHTFRRILGHKYKGEDIHFVPVEPDRDASAALNVLTRSLTKLGAVCSEETLVETALSTGTTVGPAQSVVEAGIPALTERSIRRAG